MHLSLLVKSILAHRGIAGLGGYDSCCDPEESIVHVLRDCPIAKAFWEGSACLVNLRQSLSEDLESWIKKNALGTIKTPSKDYD